MLDEPVLLVDEVESGVHDRALPDVVRYLFRASWLRAALVD